MGRYAKYCKGLLLVCLSSLALVGCDFGSDTLTTGYYKDVGIRANGEFVVKNKIEDDKAKKVIHISMLKSVKTVLPKIK